MKIPEPFRRLISRNPVVLVATSDRTGRPHLAAAKGLLLLGEDLIAFENWFCFQTLSNLAENPRISISVMEPASEQGFQIIGTVERSIPTAMLNGFTSQEAERKTPFPQTEYRFQVRIESVLELSTGPHSDAP
jgi:predicted pyridoxine 5'-phosphate oxidase superfamily flavin-nucleotide-binding protein